MSEIASFRRDGYLVKKGLFRKSELQAVQDEAKSVFALQLRHHGLLNDAACGDAALEKQMMDLFRLDQQAFVGAAKQCQHLVSMHRLALRDELLETMKILGVTHPVICTRPVMYFNSRHLAVEEGYYKSPVHQDWRSTQGSLDSIVSWLPLVPVNRALGALQIVPGSHRRGLLPTETDADVTAICRITRPFADEDFMSLELDAGDVVFFSTFLVHRSGDNVTDRLRWSMHFRYNNIDEPTFIERKFAHPYIYKPNLKILTPEFPSERDLSRIFER